MKYLGLSAIASLAIALGDKAKGLFRKDEIVNHFDDLKYRLQIVIDRMKPKGFRKNIGSTLPYKNKLKKDALNEVLSREKQFKGEKLPDGRNRYFLKDGIYIDRLGQ